MCHRVLPATVGLWFLVAGSTLSAEPPQQETGQTAAPSASADARASTLEIRSDDNKVIIAAEQIRFYDWTTHTHTLAPGAREELAKRIRKDGAVSEIPFALTVGGELIYKGTFTSAASTRNLSTPVIVVDATNATPKLWQDQIRIQLGYPKIEFYLGQEPRNDPRVRVALEENGKLVAGESVYNDWISTSLLKMQTIKPGMTRSDLLKVFQEEGGLVRSHRPEIRIPRVSDDQGACDIFGSRPAGQIGRVFQRQDSEDFKAVSGMDDRRLSEATLPSAP